MKLKITLLVTLCLPFACTAMDDGRQNGNALYLTGISPQEDDEDDFAGGAGAAGGGFANAATEEEPERPETPVYIAEIHVSIPIKEGQINKQRFKIANVRVTKDTKVGHLAGLVMAATENYSPISFFLDGQPLNDESVNLADIFGDNIEQNISKVIGTFEKRKDMHFEDVPRDTPAEPQSWIETASVLLATGRQWLGYSQSSAASTTKKPINEN